MELKYFKKKQFKTLCKSIEVILCTDNNNVITPEQAALRLDQMIADANAPALDQVGKIFWLLEWIVPPLVMKFPPFSKLSLSSRRSVIEKVIGNKGMFKDLARGLKVMASVSYYSSIEAQNQVGFVPFDKRNRFVGLDTSPSIHLNQTNHA